MLKDTSTSFVSGTKPGEVPGRDHPVQVSVIIPTYNYGRFLLECLESVFAQSVKNLEVIVVDDGSTDNTSEILASISDFRLKVIRTANRGVSAARNTGLQTAAGEFLAFLDADDRWRPEKLERQLGVLVSEPSVGVVFTDLLRFNENDFLANAFSFYPELASIRTRPSLQGQGRVIIDDAFCELISFAQFPIYVQTLLFRKSLAQGIDFPPREEMSEDLYFSMRLYGKAEVAYIEEPLVEVRRHGNNSFQLAWEKIAGDLVALRKLERDEDSVQHKKAIHNRIGKLYAQMGHHYFWHRQPIKSAKSYVNCLAYPDYRIKAFLHLLMLPITPFLAPKSDGR